MLLERWAVEARVGAHGALVLLRLGVEVLHMPGQRVFVQVVFLAVLALQRRGSPSFGNEAFMIASHVGKHAGMNLKLTPAQSALVRPQLVMHTSHVTQKVALANEFLGACWAYGSLDLAVHCRYVQSKILPQIERVATFETGERTHARSRVLKLMLPPMHMKIERLRAGSALILLVRVDGLSVPSKRLARFKLLVAVGALVLAVSTSHVKSERMRPYGVEGA